MIPWKDDLWYTRKQIKTVIRGEDMGKGTIAFGASAALIAAVMLTVRYAVRLGIDKDAGFDKIAGSDPEVRAGWDSYDTQIDESAKGLRNLTGENLWMRSFDGLMLHAKLSRHETGESFAEDKGAGVSEWDVSRPAGVVILSPGYRCSVYRDFCGIAEELFEKGYDLLFVDHRTQGKSEGKYICFGQSEAKDIAAWSKFIEEKYDSEVPFYLYGVSMGATTVMLAAGEEISNRVKAIVADCGFTSAEEIVKHMIRKVLHLPAFPLYSLVDREFRRKTGCTFSRSTVPVLAESALPILFIHGKADGFVYPWMSEKNYEAAAAGPGDKRLLMIEGANHAQSYLKARKTVSSAIFDFLESHR